jgi:hypothetical protein
MSLLRETIDPRLKNVTWEIVATMLDTPLRARSRSMITFEINIMGGFKTMLLTCQQDLRSVRPVHLRPVVAQTSGDAHLEDQRDCQSVKGTGGALR